MIQHNKKNNHEMLKCWTSSQYNKKNCQRQLIKLLQLFEIQ